ncbi:DUF484 family protein [Flagellatimonas centrodinii]|uniref:DUF484 family protein n=1 Tax=Flagellatimonas centrodinii TaxID=2806210 RepID=UPI001FEE01EC|nr:DUF484 family protein [Flagellatimonas centrodinii]ULQ45201.1 DUF484 family protein [Flagellatimonas centrodinii]
MSEAGSPNENNDADEVVAAAVDEGAVLAFLTRHPDLLSRHPEVLETLELRHRAGSAVSLMERQVDLLRARNERLESRLSRLTDAARDNEGRAGNVHRLARTLIRAPSLAAVVAGLRQVLREDFDIDEVFIGLNNAYYKRSDIDGLTPIEAEGKVAKAFENFFRTRLIECGPITEARARLLFPRAEETLQSAAVVPLEKEKYLGMLAFGSRDPERFQPRQGKLFLEMIAELVAAAVRARLG